jgi:rhamnosyltransferase
VKASVLVRAKDEAEHIGQVLDIVRNQTVDAELIVVDSGSTDGTGDIAREHGANVIWIPAESFTFGGSLNTGTEAATGDIVVALSAHAFPRDDRWLERMLAPFEDPRVACACGADAGPRGEPLDALVHQDEELARRFPYWGYSNAAGAYRRSLWEQYRFRPEMPGTEDKEWSWHWIMRGGLCVLGPELTVEHDHTKDPIRDTWVRARREWIGFAMYLDLDPLPLGDAFRQWRRESRQYRHPMNVLREGVRVAGEWSVRRDGRRFASS